MTAIVVFNPTNIPANSNGIVVGAGEWVFVEDIDKVSALIASGRLVVSKAPADPVQVNPQALNAFEKLNEHNGKLESAKNAEQTKRKSRNNKSQTSTDTIEGE